MNLFMRMTKSKGLRSKADYGWIEGVQLLPYAVEYRRTKQPFIPRQVKSVPTNMGGSAPRKGVSSAIRGKFIHVLYVMAAAITS